MKHARKLIDDLRATLSEGIELVDKLSDESYVATVPGLAVSSIGAHYRHHLDHVRSVVMGFDSGVIDYDERVRGTDIEFDRAVAIQATTELSRLLGELTDETAAGPVLVLLRSSCAAEVRPQSPSTVMRELAFVQSHAVHHFALIGFIAKALGLQTPDEFGVAPSTLRYQANC